MKKITILTRRVSVKDFVFKSIRNVLRFLKYLIKGGITNTDTLFYSGHTAVTRSLVTGLKEAKIDFVYNPIFEKDITDNVIVLSDMKALQQMIQLKKSGQVKRILAGPNLIDLPTENNKALTDPEIDIVIVPSEMVKQIYEKLNPSLIGKIAIWYAGVDINYWKPEDKNKNDEILVYWKDTTPKPFCLEVESIIKKCGYNVNRINYGKYNKKHYKNSLNRSKYAVFLSMTETQGLALIEAWSMNVPTLVWYPGIEHSFIRSVVTTSAPYLTDDTGKKWKELNDLENLLLESKSKVENFSPRKWVLENMTDKISAEMIVEICDNVK